MLWLGFVAGVIICADRRLLGWFFGWVNGIPFGDKAGHFFLIGVLAMLLNHALSYQVHRISRWQWQRGGLVVLLVMTMEEFSQLWFSSRSFDVGDLLANALGVLAAEWIARRRTP